MKQPLWNEQEDRGGKWGPSEQWGDHPVPVVKVPVVKKDLTTEYELDAEGPPACD